MISCPLCKEFKATDLSSTSTVGERYEDSRIVAFNDDLCVFPGVGCYVNGYLLLSTVEHYLSLCNCPDEIVKKIDGAIPQIRALYGERLGCGSVFFEHGTVADFEISPASINHFHMHFMPVNEPIWDKINAQYDFEYYPLRSIAEVKDVVAEKRISSYLLFGDYDGKIYMINSPPDRYHSQFLRRVMYEHYYGEREENYWNWKLYPYSESMKETFEIMKGFKLIK
jgi:hypothetical protein